LHTVRIISCTPNYRDLDLRPRFFDRAQNMNVHGTCDVGAYELAPLVDLIFEDGFE
jgi:hypothetical protein